MQISSMTRGQKAIHIAAVAVASLCAGRGVLARSLNQSVSAPAVPEMTASSLSSLHFGPVIANPAAHAFSAPISSLPLNSPPINGFVPQVVFGLTDELDPGDFNFAAHKSSVPGGSTMPFFGSPYYAVAVYDTGSQSHLISYSDTQTFNFTSANREGDSVQEITGASGSEFC